MNVYRSPPIARESPWPEPRSSESDMGFPEPATTQACMAGVTCCRGAAYGRDAYACVLQIRRQLDVICSRVGRCMHVTGSIYATYLHNNATAVQVISVSIFDHPAWQEKPCRLGKDLQYLSWWALAYVCADVVQRGFCGFAPDNGPYDTMLDSTNRRPKLRSEREAAASSAPPS